MNKMKRKFMCFTLCCTRSFKRQNIYSINRYCIYSFGILACEVLTGLPPYHNLPHDEFLALKICQGLRPKFKNVKVPPLLENLIDQCLEANPLKRPTADELFNLISRFNVDMLNKSTEFGKQYKEAEEFSQSITSNSNVVSPSS